ncbi:MAG TPA: hypothetical protein DCP51_03330 [Clostridiales bacterium]|nr:MAG: hypothetical protein A2Y40_06380 [Candidatus Margulisbacteria bacterium GWF2_35_9]HAN20697.1 hypothetical protein [Clostridiales bacterium]
MKRLLVLLLAMGLIFTFAACGEDETSKEESATSSTSSVAGNDDESSEAEASEATSEEASEDNTSEVTSDDVSDETPSEVTFTNKFVSWGEAIGVAARGTDSTSIRFTKVNEAPVAGDVVLFTNDYGSTISAGSETYADYAVLVCTYDKTVFGYKKTSLKQVGEDSAKASTRIPTDGFVVAISKDQATELGHLSNIKDADKFFVHGIQIGDLSVSLKKATKAPKIDGNISKTEYGTSKWVVNENNKLWDYSQFKGQYYATAEVFATYDNDNLYLGVVVDSPYHHCPLTQTNAGSMWQYECIQVNVSSVDPSGDYMSEHFDHAIDPKASQEGVVRQYGFAANEENETLSVVWMGVDTTFTGEAFCKRDDTKEMTYYEVAIPWAELGSDAMPFDVTKADTVGFSISINSSNEDDATWKNIMMRDGGGIIGRNDFSKIAIASLD